MHICNANPLPAPARDAVTPETIAARNEFHAAQREFTDAIVRPTHVARLTLLGQIDRAEAYIAKHGDHDAKRLLNAIMHLVRDEATFDVALFDTRLRSTALYIPLPPRAIGEGPRYLPWDRIKRHHRCTRDCAAFTRESGLSGIVHVQIVGGLTLQWLALGTLGRMRWYAGVSAFGLRTPQMILADPLAVEAEPSFFLHRIMENVEGPFDFIEAANVVYNRHMNRLLDNEPDLTPIDADTDIAHAA